MKQKYVKPVIEKVKLVASEAVLQACKAPVAGGPTVTGCWMVSAQQPCSGIGS